MRAMQMALFEKVPIDQVEIYWDARPCNIRHSSKPIGSKEYFNEVEKRKYFVEPHIPIFADFSRWREKKVLEIGCGIGTDTINFARKGAHVTAIDISEKSLNIAKQRAKVFKLSNRISFYHGNCEELDQIVPVEEYDLVYSFGVIHHTPNPRKAIEKIKKYLGKKNGELRVMLYSRASYKLFWIMKEEKIWDMSRLDELIARNSEAESGCPVTYTYSLREVQELLFGFDILELRKEHIFTWDIEAYKKYEYKKDAAWESVSDKQLKELEQELGWHTLIRARLCS
jgi:ubiquinone/menaquinone biosynthesis C-methylase UbiE